MLPHLPGGALDHLDARKQLGLHLGTLIRELQRLGQPLALQLRHVDLRSRAGNSAALTYRNIKTMRIPAACAKATTCPRSLAM